MSSCNVIFKRIFTSKYSKYLVQQCRLLNSAEVTKSNESIKRSIDFDVRFKYPEFLPDPNVEYRNPIREKLERQDMLDRRTQINIPEFYVGSIVAVTSSNIHAPTKTSKFVGICILREGCGLRSTFMLRNVIDNMGIDERFSLYDPTIQKIDVLRLEKRLDDNLMYLRDALPEYSTVPLDMEPEYLPEGTPIPVNPVKVTLKPRPWRARYELHDYKGIANLYTYLPKKLILRASKHAKPWEKYDLMKQYRETIPMEEQEEIYSEIYPKLQRMEIVKKKIKRKKEFTPPKKTA